VIHEIGNCCQKWEEYVQLIGTYCLAQRYSVDAENEEGAEDCREAALLLSGD